MEKFTFLIKLFTFISRHCVFYIQELMFISLLITMASYSYFFEGWSLILQLISC